MVSSRLSLSSSLSFTRTSSLSILERRKRLRRILLESLENRMLMAFDPMELAGDAAWVDSRQEGLPGYRVDLDAVLKGQDLPPVETVAYLERVFGSASGSSVDQPWFPTIQRAYDHWSHEQGLAFSYSTLTGEGELLGEGEAGGPRLLSVAPNSGDIFSFNTLNTLPESPTELVFRFDGSDGIRTSSIANGIRVTRSGRDGVFGNGNDQVILPGFLGLGDNDRIVVMRFASTLPDDTYRVEVMGEDVPAQGLNAIQNLAGRKLTARSGDRDVVNFKLELGAQVVAVVPQPVDRSATNTISMTGNSATLSLTARQGGLAQAAVGTNVNFRINQTAAATTVASYVPATNTLTVDVGVNGTLSDVATAINSGLAGDFSATVVTNGGYVIAAADAGSRVVSLGSTVLDPKLNQIRVYFNNDDLFATRVTTNPLGGNPSVVDPASYQLILTNDTVQPNDDRAFLPSSVTYDPATDIATLTFASNIEQLAGTGTYRLRVGTKDAVETSSNLPAVSVRAPADPQGFVSGAQGLGTNPADAAGVVNGSLSVLVNQSIITNNTNDLPIDFPGSNFEPGHRDIQDETHQNGTEDGNPQISTLFYNFALDRSYGNNALGQPVFTSITPEQMQRVREIFEFYSEQAGIDVVESVGSGFTIVVGDLFPNGAISGPSGTLGVANSQTGLAIIDGADVWNNAFGGSFMRTTMHEIGHLLGLGHATDLPSGTFMQGFADPNPPADGPFPGDFDVNHLQFLHRPDNRDVDLYRFEIPVGTTGQVRIETMAERLASSSNLDSHLTLFRQLPDGKLEVVSANDDYFSEDSFLQATVTAGVYFIGVTSTGNQDYNPLTGNTGSGGTSQGTYQLRFDFVPTLNTSITDTSGTVLDGDGDGQAGGNFDFWFRAAAPVGTASPEVPKTIYVDKGYAGAQNGSAAQPYSSIPAAVAAAVPGDVIRVVGSIGADNSIATTGDNPAYEIGRGGVGNVVLSDGVTLEVPNGVTLMLEPERSSRSAAAESSPVVAMLASTIVFRRCKSWAFLVTRSCSPATMTSRSVSTRIHSPRHRPQVIGVDSKFTTTSIELKGVATTNAKVFSSITSPMRTFGMVAARLLFLRQARPYLRSTWQRPDLLFSITGLPSAPDQPLRPIRIALKKLVSPNLATRCRAPIVPTTIASAPRFAAIRF